MARNAIVLRVVDPRNRNASVPAAAVDSVSHDTGPARLGFDRSSAAVRGDDVALSLRVAQDGRARRAYCLVGDLLADGIGLRCEVLRR